MFSTKVGAKLKFSFEKDKNYVVTKQMETITISTSSSFPVYPGEHVNAMQILLIVPMGYNKRLDDFEIAITLFQPGGKDEETLKPGPTLDDLIMTNMNPEYRQKKQEEEHPKVQKASGQSHDQG